MYHVALLKRHCNLCNYACSHAARIGIVSSYNTVLLYRPVFAYLVPALIFRDDLCTSVISGDCSNRFMADFGPLLDEELLLEKYLESTEKIRMLTDINFYGGSHSFFSVNIITLSFLD